MPLQHVDRIEQLLTEARLADDGSNLFRQGIANLELLINSAIPIETVLLPNYPNPFNPETWIPYDLAEAADVRITIYNLKGESVKRLKVGFQAPGTYRTQSRAAYWDGCNAVGEPVASGVYFYTLQAGQVRASRKMVITKIRRTVNARVEATEDILTTVYSARFPFNEFESRCCHTFNNALT